MAGLVKLTASAIRVGKPLPWPVFDENNKLLLNQGYVIETEAQLGRLLARGIYQPDQNRGGGGGKSDDTAVESKKINPFSEYSVLLERLEQALGCAASKQADAERQILLLAKTIDTLCQSDADACMAIVHIYAVEPTAFERTLFYGILCSLMGRKLQLEAPRLIALMGAALTANLALLAFQDKLNNSNKVLTPEQRVIINKHPLLSAQALKAAGVNNPLWLEIILQHHERFDGSGYPRQLKTGQICIEARILSLAERYVAMISKRAYRQSFLSAEAVTKLHEADQSDPIENHLEALAVALSPFPSGCFVQLVNDEIAIVTRRTHLPERPKAQAVVSAKGSPFLGSFKRETHLDEFRPVKLVTPLNLPALNLPSLWD